MTPAFNHIERFNRTVLKLFIQLYDVFPHPQNISNQAAIELGFGEITGPATGGEAMGLGTKTTNVMEWLKEEAFIRFEPDPNYRPGTFCKVRLTIKGITLLAYMPVSLQQTDQKEPLIQKAKQAIESNDHEMGNRVIAEIFRRAMGQQIS